MSSTSLGAPEHVRELQKCLFSVILNTTEGGVKLQANKYIIYGVDINSKKKAKQSKETESGGKYLNGRDIRYLVKVSKW